MKKHYVLGACAIICSVLSLHAYTSLADVPVSSPSATPSPVTSPVPSATAWLWLDVNSPLTSSVSVTDTTNNQYLGLPVLVFDVSNPTAADLRSLTARVTSPAGGSGGSIGTAYLYASSTLVSSATVINGFARFTNIASGVFGSHLAAYATTTYVIKVDVTGVTSGPGFTVQSAVSGYDVSLTDSVSGQMLYAVGKATGNPVTVVSSGPVFSLTGTPMVSMQTVSNGFAGVVNLYTATFNVNVAALGSNISFGLPNSSYPMFTSNAFIGLPNSFTVCKNGLATSITGSSSVASYSQPANTSLSADGSSFVVARNQVITIPVTYTFSVQNPGANIYGVHLNRINWSSGTPGFTDNMASNITWSTPGGCIGYASPAVNTVVTPLVAIQSNLSLGSRGQQVKALQDFLIAHNYTIASIAAGGPEGYFGQQTYAAVRRFQADNGLSATGYVGRMTRATLNALVGSTGGDSGAQQNTSQTPWQTPVPVVTTNPSTPVTTLASTGAVNCPAGNVCTPTQVGSTLMSQGESVIFDKTFNVSNTSSPVSLTMAADNQFMVTVNGTLVQNNLNEWNFATPATFDLTPFVRTGSNTLEIKVTNLIPPYVAPGWVNNPAGLIYKVTQAGSILVSSDGTETDTSSTLGKGTAAILSGSNYLWTTISGAKWIWSYDGFAGSNSSQPSTPVIPVTLGTAPVPTGLVATNYAGFIDLNWNGILLPNNPGYLVGYNVYRNGVKISSATANYFVDTSVSSNTTYTYTVTAYYYSTMNGIMSNTESLQSAPAYGSISPAPSPAANPGTSYLMVAAPAAPTGLTPTPHTSSVDLTWTAPASPNGYLIGYNIYRNGTKISSASANFFTDATLSANTNYTYTVTAYFYSNTANIAQAESAQSASVVTSLLTSPVSASPTPTPSPSSSPTATPVAVPAPAAPMGLVATGNPASIDLRWTAPVSTTGYSVGFNIYRNGVKIASSNTGAFTDGTVATNVTYYYTVTAYYYSSSGQSITQVESPVSNMATARTLSPSPSPSPSSTP